MIALVFALVGGVAGASLAQYWGMGFFPAAGLTILGALLLGGGFNIARGVCPTPSWDFATGTYTREDTISSRPGTGSGKSPQN